MVIVAPFKGFTFNKEKILNLDDVMSPPYDIISDEMQSNLYEKHPNNYVRLILGKQKKEDNLEENRYTRAKKLFNSWIENGILIQSGKPSIYPYKIEYEINKTKKKMSGFFILLKLDTDYKHVRAHEKTLSKPKADRLNLLRACNANLEPIELLYVDDDDIIRKKIEESSFKPFLSAKGYEGFIHRIWKIEDEKVINFVQEELKNKILFIADGHHRYQTSINYANELREKTGDRREASPFNYMMVILANIFDEGLSILPTHRLIKKGDIDFDDFINKLKEFFIIEKRTVSSTNISDTSKMIKKDLKSNEDHKLVLYRKNKYYVLNLIDEKIMDDFADKNSKTWRTLDVSILHKLILEKLLHINQENIEDHIKYTRVDEEAIQFVNEGKFDMSFLINATKIDELKAVAEAGEHMPQKSTYFLPKMLSGLVLYKM
jgi:uncharacterized protein (DUF1015 family)